MCTEDRVLMYIKYRKKINLKKVLLEDTFKRVSELKAYISYKKIIFTKSVNISLKLRTSGK